MKNNNAFDSKPGLFVGGFHQRSRVCGGHRAIHRWRLPGWLVVGAALCATHVMAAQFVETVVPGWTNMTQKPWVTAWGDYDGDGYLDAFVPRSAGFTGTATNLLFRNNGDGSFTAKLAAEVGSIASDRDLSIGGEWADANNDGHLDLLVVNNMPAVDSPPVNARLYLNNGDGTFTSINAGDLTRPHYTYGWGHWADFDRDGHLDVFLCTAAADGAHRTNSLFRGVGDGTFVQVTTGPVAMDRVASGASNEAQSTDLDGDGDQDLLVSNFDRDFVYRNEGFGTFTRWTGHILERAGNGSLRYFPADLDNDGDLDLIWSSTSGRVYFNDGQGNFVLQQTINAMTPEAGDFDNDGDLDVLFVGDGDAQRSKLYTNDGTGKLTLDTVAMPEAGQWNGAVWVDYDNDGFLDQFMTRPSGLTKEHVLFRNQGNTNRWLKVRLAGTVSNRSALGAKVRVFATWGGRSVWQLREITAFLNAPDGLRAHFGLADAARAEVVRIEWPSGTVQELVDVAPNQILTVVEPPAIRVTATRVVSGLRIGCESAPNTVVELQRSMDATHWNAVSTTTTDAEGRGVMDIVADGGSGFYRAIRR